MVDDALMNMWDVPVKFSIGIKTHSNRIRLRKATDDVGKLRLIQTKTNEI